MTKEENTLRIYGNILDLMEKAPWYVFMNHGYAPFDKKLDKPDEKWRYQVGLYHTMFELGLKYGMSENLNDKNLLEAGSGRGGGLSYIHRTFGLKKAVGLDLFKGHTAFCQQNHHVKGLEFLQGNALYLPFKKGEFDILLNVESAHCYEDIQRFFNEAFRVLKKDGYFLFTDITFPLFHPNTTELYRAVKSAGFNILHTSYITDNVRKACENDRIEFKSRFAFAEKAQLKFMTDLAEKKEKIYRERRKEYLVIIARK